MLRATGAPAGAPWPRPLAGRLGGGTMKDAFDDLERGLRAAVRARRRPRLVRMPVLALAAALVLGGGGAVAATRIATSPSAEREGIELAHRAVGDTIAAPACGRPAKAGRTAVG